MNTKDNKIFYNPVDAGFFDLGVTQLNKLLPFASVAGVVLAAPNAKVDVLSKSGVLIKTYTEGSGFTVSGTNTPGILKSVDLILSGTDFVNWAGETLTCKCTFFTIGDIEIVFGLKIIG
jgi:hypothetical protein